MSEISFEYNGKTFGLDIKNVGLEHCSPRKKHEQRKRSYHSLHFVMYGMGTLCVNGTKHLLGKGNAFVLYANDEYEYWPDAFNPWSYIWIDFYCEESEDLLAFCGFTKEKPYTKVDDYLVMMDFCKKLVENYGMGGVKTLTTSAYALLVFEQLIEYRNRYDKVDKKNSPFYKQFIDVLTYMNNNYRMNLSLDKIAEDMNVSKRQLMYMFRTYIDLTPIDYMNKFRVSNACALLKQRDIKVEQVSEMVGIEDEKYFMRLFKKVVGMTPKEYRQNCEDDDPFVWLKEKNIDLR